MPIGKMDAFRNDPIIHSDRVNKKWWLVIFGRNLGYRKHFQLPALGWTSANIYEVRYQHRMPHAVLPKVREAFPCHRPSQSHSRLALGLCVCGLYGEATCTGYLQSGEGGGSFYATEEIEFHEPRGTLPVQRAWWGRVPFQCKCSRRNCALKGGNSLS